MDKKAFTVAEILLVLGIIGIVAALTIPNIQQRTNEKELVSSYLKLHSVLNNAYKETEAEKEYKIYGIQPDRFREYLEEHLKTRENCRHDVCLRDGSYFDYECNETQCEYITVDTNGKKKPNQSGKDIYKFKITNKGLISEGEQEICSGYDCGNYVLSHHKIFDGLLANCEDYGSDGRCIQCGDGYKVDNGLCTNVNMAGCKIYSGESCSVCNDTYYNKDGLGTCEEIPIENCAKSDNGTTCNSCVDGYLLASAQTSCSKIFKVNNMDVAVFGVSSTNNAIIHCSSIGNGYELADFDALTEIWNNKANDTTNIPQNGVYCSSSRYAPPKYVSSTSSNGYANTDRTWCVNFDPNRPYNASYINNNGSYIQTGAIWDYPKTGYWSNGTSTGAKYMCIKK